MLQPTTTSGHFQLPDGGSLYLETHGDPAATPLVLVHGGNMDRRVWTPQIGAFAAEYHVVTYDVRGFGRSSDKDRPHQAHRDLFDLLTHLDLKDPVHLAGLSLGGRIAVDFALTYPKRVRSLVLVAPGLSGWQWKPAEWTGILMAMQNLSDPKCARAAVVETWLASPGMYAAMEQSHLRATLRAWTADNTRDLLLRQPDPDSPLDPPAVGRLDTITVPALLFVGTRDTADTRDVVGLLARDLPHPKLVELPGVGHIPTLEAPDRVTHEVLTFLSGIR